MYIELAQGRLQASNHWTYNINSVSIQDWV